MIDQSTVSELSMDVLVEKISYGNKTYREGSPMMSDPEWDMLMEELEFRDPEHPLIMDVAPEISDSDPRKEKTPILMKSMTKVKTLEAILKWVTKHTSKSGYGNHELIALPKYDGNALCAHELKHLAWTKGKNNIGRRSHEHFKAFNDTPLNEDFYTYGETIMSRSVFYDKYSDDEENPRNTVGGIMIKDSVTDKTRDVNYVRFGLVKDDMSEFTNKSDIIDFLNDRQQVKVPYSILNASELTEEGLKDLFIEWSKIYEIDGIILEFNDLSKQNDIGREKNGNPAYARAYKGDFEEVSGEVTILEMISQISKKGYLFPVMLIPPTRLDGATVKRITGNNFRFIKDNGLGKGAIITLKRSGMVIPKVVKVIKTVDFEMPDVGVPVDWDESGVHLITLEETDEQKVQYIKSFFSILGVEDVSEGTCQMMFDHGLTSIKSILEATQKDLVEIDGFRDRKAEIVFTQIQKRMKGVEISKLQHASGCFENLGSKKLILLENITDPTVDDIISIEGFSDISANAYIEGLPKYKEFLDEIGDLVTVKVTEIKEVESSDMEGLVFVFSGVRRADLNEVIETQGGKIASGVSAKITHLVCKDPNSGSSKVVKAKDLGKEVITVGELEQMLSKYM